jgi:uncharacterized protein (DUF2126 family)/transglutaminase-like putative cysteine protease
MSIRVALHHRSSYRYDRSVNLGPQMVRLRPAPHCRTPVLAYSFQVEPREHFINWQQDPHGNFLARLVFPAPTRRLTLTVDLVAELTVVNPFDFFLEADAVHYPFLYPPELLEDLKPYLRVDQGGSQLQEFLAAAPRCNDGTVDFLVDVNRYVHDAVRYIIRMEPGVQTCEETLLLRSGSCRDSAWLLVQTLRHLGLAARFVSGYLIQLRPDVKSLDGPSGTDHDFTDLHAWAEVYLPGAGWVGLDPTSGLLTGEGHLPLAAAPEPASAAPISGAIDLCKVDFDVDMSVERIHEEPRTTKPYTERQWLEVLQLGRQVDARLEKGNVRLTMGGEPTFVSIDDMDGAEWTVAALGPVKRQRAEDLFRRLAKRFATGPLLHFGQGKWYPGESLPRWALGAYWRTDGVPIWRDPSLVADVGVNYHVGPDHAKAFIESLARRLGVDPTNAAAGYEDAWYYLWRERRLPVNVDPLRSNLDSAEERKRLADVFERGLGEVVGYALPLAASDASAGPRWQSCRWTLRQGHLFLAPGDSPMGFRLPLDSIPWISPGERPVVAEVDPMTPRGPLPQFVGNGDIVGEAVWRTQYASAVQNSEEARKASGEGAAQKCETASKGTVPFLLRQKSGQSPGEKAEAAKDQPPTATPLTPAATAGVVRTAICVEPRQGRLMVFMPPVGCLEDYLQLTAAVEATAAELHQPVAIEGYTPPADCRVRQFRVTPDPGVIEVNIQPSYNWDELVENTTVLYDEARLARLGTEKFMLDGRDTGTGGGNHVVLGGPTPAESPFLRRPDLLKSFLIYWNNHPSLSYVFSNWFIGPTSQAPRLDEARSESLYELEIAFRELAANEGLAPWLVDRVFRHLLVDVTGNTHRAEFCIDKLFSPDSPSGRLGLVELRAFEMPPHAEMSLAQQLLVRALVAWFWEKPYNQRLERWGTSLHDRFMLPHFLAADFADVLGDLQSAGFAFSQDWFASHFEFRFPRCGNVVYDGVELELRQAMEPWHVLGEEGRAEGTVRCVDASAERIQVKVRGLTDSRHIVACNGRRVPLHPTGVRGEAVAGVRFRAWKPPSCLHPTIDVHTPLVFDIFDLWTGRSLGGCTWHVAHPGGRNFERFPVNAYEAESRRAARFIPRGYTGCSPAIPAAETNRDYPLTLDLRFPTAESSLDG